MNIQDTLRQALTHHQQRRFKQAEQLYRQILSQQPSHASALHHLGLLAKEANRFPEAIEMLSRSVQLEPANVSFRTNLIGALDGMGQFDAAETAARKLVSDFPNDLRLRAEFAKLLSKYGRFDLAAAEWAILSEKAPTDVAVAFFHAYSLQLSGLLMQAEKRYRDAIALNNDFGEAHLNLAGLLFKTNRPDESRTSVQRAAELMPNHPQVHSLHGVLLANAGKVTEGLERARAAHKLAPADPAILQNLAYVHNVRGESALAMLLYREIARLTPYSLEAFSCILMMELYLEVPENQQADIYRGLQSAESRLLPAKAPTPNKRSAGDRIRIAYVSSDFRAHPVGAFIEPVLAGHDRSKFEITCLYTGTQFDEQTKRIVTLVDRFYDANASSSVELDLLVRELGIDILIDLAGHTGGNRLDLLARRPAALQVTYLGYPNSTGLKSIDLRITDAIADPPGKDPSHYTERQIRLNHSFGLFAPIADAAPVSPLPFDTNGYITFGNIGRHEKWSDGTLASWARIMQRVPNSRLRLVGAGLGDETYREQRARHLRAAGIDTARVDFVPRLDFLEFLKEVGNSDFLLDTHLFNGHTTTLQSLYMGVPTVTLAGNTHRSRLGASVLTPLGLTDLIGHTPSEFEEIAVALANDPPRLRGLRTGLRQRLEQSSLCDADGFVREFEAALLSEWKKLAETSSEHQS